MKCAEIKEMLPSYVRGEGSLAVRRHLARCPACRTELERYQALGVALNSMQEVAIAPPSGLLSALLAIPGDVSRVDSMRSHVVRNKKVYAGGVVVAIAGAAGAALWRTRTRRLAPT